jgi:hypothetical protein
MRIMTGVWGVGYVLEAAIRVVSALTLTPGTVVILSPIMGIGTTIGLILWTRKYGRTVQERAAREDAPEASAAASRRCRSGGLRSPRPMGEVGRESASDLERDLIQRVARDYGILPLKSCCGISFSLCLQDSWQTLVSLPSALSFSLPTRIIHPAADLSL